VRLLKREVMASSPELKLRGYGVARFPPAVPWIGRQVGRTVG
jgi:hypothetical protein